MSEVRRCDARCHNAKHAHCDCWCGGLFHGKAGEEARQAFAQTFGADVPALPPAPDGGEQLSLSVVSEGGRRWQAAIAAARAAAALDVRRAALLAVD
jgi:hypothetical protein